MSFGIGEDDKRRAGLLDGPRNALLEFSSCSSDGDKGLFCFVDILEAVDGFKVVTKSVIRFGLLLVDTLFALDGVAYFRGIETAFDVLEFKGGELMSCLLGVVALGLVVLRN